MRVLLILVFTQARANASKSYCRGIIYLYEIILLLSARKENQAAFNKTTTSVFIVTSQSSHFTEVQNLPPYP